MSGYTYFNPTKIHFGIGKRESLPALLGSRRALVFTSQGFSRRQVFKDLIEPLPNVTAICSEINPNPDILELRGLFETFTSKNDHEVIVAFGGGSVMDAAKLQAVRSREGGFAAVEQLLRAERSDLGSFQPKPVIALATTSGTGSEVSPWGTIWDRGRMQKLSISHPELFCEHAICDPELTLSLPAETTLHSGLDALSHCLESIWNTNRSPISLTHAIRAARVILKVLPKLMDDLENIKLRSAMMEASMQAGLAFSNTQTAIAHGLSYYLTLKKGTPHGLACSFSLARIAKAVFGVNREIDNILLEICGTEPPVRISSFLNKLGVSEDLDQFKLSSRESEELFSSLQGTSRLKNFVGSAERVQRLMQEV